MRYRRSRRAQEVVIDPGEVDLLRIRTLQTGFVFEVSSNITESRALGFTQQVDPRERDLRDYALKKGLWTFEGDIGICRFGDLYEVLRFEGLELKVDLGWNQGPFDPDPEPPRGKRLLKTLTGDVYYSNFGFAGQKVQNLIRVQVGFAEGGAVNPNLLQWAYLNLTLIQGYMCSEEIAYTLTEDFRVIPSIDPPVVSMEQDDTYYQYV